MLVKVKPPRRYSQSCYADFHFILPMHDFNKNAKFILIKMLTNTQQTKSLENGKTLENSRV